MATILAHYNHRADAANALLASLPGNGHRAVAANLMDPDAIPALAEQVNVPLSALVHNAGIYEASPCNGDNLEEWRDAWRRQFQVNLFAAADLTFALLPRLEEGRGAVVHIASRAGHRGEAGFSAYAASKAAMKTSPNRSPPNSPRAASAFSAPPRLGETDMAEDALAERGHAIAAEIPQGRVAEPDDVANLVAFFLNPAPATCPASP